MNKNKDMDIVQELLAEIFMHSGSVYTVGAGNNVQEDILKNMSSPPQEVNNGFVLMDYLFQKARHSVLCMFLCIVIVGVECH